MPIEIYRIKLLNNKSRSASPKTDFRIDLKDILTSKNVFLFALSHNFSSKIINNLLCLSAAPINFVNLCSLKSYYSNIKSKKCRKCYL